MAGGLDKGSSCADVFSTLDVSAMSPLVPVPGAPPPLTLWSALSWNESLPSGYRNCGDESAGDDVVECPDDDDDDEDDDPRGWGDGELDECDNDDGDEYDASPAVARPAMDVPAAASSLAGVSGACGGTAAGPSAAEAGQ